MINYSIFKKVLASLILVLSLTLIGTGCNHGDGAGSGDGFFVGDGLYVVSEGTTLSLTGINQDGDVVEIDSAALPPVTVDGFLDEHAIFSITKYPSENWLYVTSMNDCSGVVHSACWGNARIDRFSYSALGIAHEEITFEYLFSSGPACADEPSGFAGVTGLCAPTASAFSSDGLRLYVNEDNIDGVEIFGVNPASGFLTYLSEGATTRLQGIAVSPNDDYVYNGAHVIQVIADVASDLVAGTQGNATEVVTNALDEDLLATTLSNRTLAIYDLVDQAAPALIDSIAVPDKNSCGTFCGAARFQDSSDDLSRFIVVGAHSVATVSFNGTTLEVLDQVFDSNPLNVMNRGVQITGDGEYAAVTWFIPYDEDDNRLMIGGVTAYGIAVDGTLTELDSIDLFVPSRAILTVSIP